MDIIEFSNQLLIVHYRPNGSSDPAPYATTTLAMQNKMRTLGGQTFVSLPQQVSMIDCLLSFCQILMSSDKIC